MKFNELKAMANKYGNFDLEKYFEKTGNKYSIFLIDYPKKKFIFQDGVNEIDIIKEFRSNFDFSNSNISALYKQLEIKDTFEVFMFNINLVESKDTELLELVIFHEICHLLEKTEYYKELEITFSDEDIRVGGQLHSIANKINNNLGGWGTDNDHNDSFGQILFYFLRVYKNEDKYKLLGKAMIKNFLDDYSEEFQNETNE